MMKEINEIPKIIAIFVIINLTTKITTFAHREHKVHNIVLYPDKHSWCKTLAIKQVISYPGCKSEEIDNNVCVGTCFSYSIPHTEPSDPGEVIVPYCDSCQPSDTTWHHVTLECTKNSVDTPPQLVKRVQIINNCSCSSCEKSFASTMHTTNQFIEDDDSDLIMSHVHDVPDVLKILNRNNETSMGRGSINNGCSGIGNGLAVNADGSSNNNGIGGNNNGGGGGGNGGIMGGGEGGGLNNINTEKVKDIKEILNHKIITLLKNIQENNSVHDKEQLIDLLRMIQGPNSKLSDKSIEDFVNSLHSENIELDIARLREILIKFEHSKLYEKHRKNFENNSSYMNNDYNDNNNGYHHQFKGSSLSSHDSNLDSSSNMNILDHNTNNNTSIENENQQNIDRNFIVGGTSNNNNGIVGGGSSNNGNGIGGNNNNIKHSQHHSHHSHHHHHHHIGENIVPHGHLTRGPHGALVIEPDDDNNHDHHEIEQHEKLDVNPHELKPNHAGTLLSYSGHSTDNSRKP